MPKKLKHLNVHAFLLSFPQILWVLILPSQIVSAQKNTTIPVNVGVVLDMDTWIGKMGLSCISMALSDFYSSHSDYKTRIVLNSRDSKKDVVGAAAAGNAFCSFNLRPRFQFSNISLYNKLLASKLVSKTSFYKKICLLIRFRMSEGGRNKVDLE